MPTFTRDDGKPIVQFNADVELSPFALFRRLRSRHPPLLLDGRKKGGSRRSLAGAIPYPDSDWAPENERQSIVVFDDDGREALDLVLSLRKRGFTQVRLLFGGLDLYEFSLDPDIVGSDTFLVRPDG